MEDDLKEGGYRAFYVLTFILVFCVLPFIFIISRGDIARKEIKYECASPQEIVFVYPPDQDTEKARYNRYQLKDGSLYTSTLKYNVGDLVCRY